MSLLASGRAAAETATVLQTLLAQVTLKTPVTKVALCVISWQTFICFVFNMHLMSVALLSFHHLFCMFLLMN